MKTVKNGKDCVFFAVLLILICMTIFFFGCAGTDGGNGNDPNASRNDGDISDGIWTIEDYDRELGTFEGLSAETEWQILVDYNNYFGSPDLVYDKNYISFLATISEYCGIYNGYIVVEIFAGMLTRQVIPPVFLGNEGYILQDPSYKTWAWKDGKFYCLEKLYSLGELTLDDLRNIARLHYHFIPASEWGKK